MLTRVKVRERRARVNRVAWGIAKGSNTSTKSRLPMTTERFSSTLVTVGFLALLFTGVGPGVRQADADPAGRVGTWHQ